MDATARQVPPPSLMMAAGSAELRMKETMYRLFTFWCMKTWLDGLNLASCTVRTILKGAFDAQFHSVTPPIRRPE